MPVLNAECPICEYYGPHVQDPSNPKMFTCVLCNTSFGTGRDEDLSYMLVEDSPKQ